MQRKLRDGEEREHKSEREEEGEEADGIEDESGVSFATVPLVDDWIKNCVDVRWAKVKAAEIQENPLEALPSFTVFNKNGVKFNLETKKY